jgi:2,3-diaminopropionate biosynthesis protein SbnA
VIFDHVYDVNVEHAFLRLPGFLPDVDIVMKLEGLNPAGSIKLKAAREMVTTAEKQGRIRAGISLIESTSGNLGIALASICAAKGYPLIVVTDPNANATRVKAIRAFGAEVVVVRDRDVGGGYLHTRVNYIKRRLAEDPNLVWLNQYTNSGNVGAHHNHTAPEITGGLGAPDWLFVGTGTSGTLMGCVRHFASVDAPTIIVAVDAVGSVTFGGPPGPRYLPGLGASRLPEIFHDNGTFLKVLVPERDAIRACRRVAYEHGLLLGGSSGSVLAGVIAMRDRIPPGSRVVAISPDLGDWYLDTIYNDDWVTARFGAETLAGVAKTNAPSIGEERNVA